MKLGRVVSAVLVYGLIGLVLTVLVAWGVALWGRSMPAPGERMAVLPNQAWLPEPGFVSRTSVHRRGATTHWGVVAGASDPEENTIVTNVIWIGWPVRALAYRRIWDQRIPGVANPDFEQGLRLPQWAWTWLGAPGAHLPVLPLWRGLVVDSAVFGLGAFGAVRVGRRMRREWRARRGRCRRCGYALGELPTCPECGEAAGGELVDRRRLLKAAVACFAIGLAMSILIAWACALWSPPVWSGKAEPAPAGQGRVINLRGLHRMSVPREWLDPTASAPPPDMIKAKLRSQIGVGYRAEILAAEHDRALTNRYGSPQYGRMRLEGGWPWSALALETDVWWDGWAETEGVKGSVWEAGLPAPGVLDARSLDVELPFTTPISRRLPIRPMPMLIADAIFWGFAAFGVMWSVRAVRGARRVRRGRCARCGYPVRGLEACPECGEASRRMDA